MGCAVQTTGMGNWIDDALTAVHDLGINIAYGTLTPAQKAAQVEAEAQAVYKAGAGRLTISQARQIAQGDTTAVLTAMNADPSQASIFNQAALDSNLFPNLSTAIKWGAIGLGAILLIVVLKD